MYWTQLTKADETQKKIMVCLSNVKYFEHAEGYTRIYFTGDYQESDAILVCESFIDVKTVLERALGRGF